MSYPTNTNAVHMVAWQQKQPCVYKKYNIKIIKNIRFDENTVFAPELFSTWDVGLTDGSMLD